MKKEIVQGLKSFDAYQLSGSVDETLKFLSKLRRDYKKQGFYNLSFEMDMNYGELEGVTLYGTRQETDEEYTKRLAKEEKRKLNQELKKQKKEMENK